MSRFWISLGSRERVFSARHELLWAKLEALATKRRNNGDLVFISENLDDARARARTVIALYLEYGWKDVIWMVSIVRQPECAACGKFNPFKSTECIGCGQPVRKEIIPLVDEEFGGKENG